MILLWSSLWEIRLAFICFCPSEPSAKRHLPSLPKAFPSHFRLGHPSVLLQPMVISQHAVEKIVKRD
jgi:hypothetical protein